MYVFTTLKLLAIKIHLLFILSLKLGCITLSLRSPQGTIRHVAVLPLLRLTNDKSFYSQHEILAVWQFFILTDRNSVGGNNFVPSQLPKWPEGRRHSRGRGEAATFYQSSLNWPLCHIQCVHSKCIFEKEIHWKRGIISYIHLHFICHTFIITSWESTKVAKWLLKGTNVEQCLWVEWTCLLP